MAKKELSEKEQEKQNKDAYRNSALKRLDDFSLWDLALPNLVSKGKYGDVSGVFEEKFNQSLYEISDKDVYKQVILPVIQPELIQKRSVAILSELVSSLYLKDVFEGVYHSKEFNPIFEGKLVMELPEKEREMVIGAYLEELTSKKVYSTLLKTPSKMAGGLEQLLSKPDKNQEKKAA